MTSSHVVPDSSPPAAPSTPRGEARRQVSDFTELAKQVKDAGLMNRRHAYYWTRFALLNVALVALAAVAWQIGESWWQLAVAAALAALLGQFMFLGHDAAHRQIFESGKWNDAASLVLANLYAGMSYGWWQHKHSRHHAKPNQVGADPDIATGALVFHLEDGGQPKTGWGAKLRARQGSLFFPLLLLEGANLHRSGLVTIFGKEPVKHRAIEIPLVVVRLGGYLALLFWFLPVGMAFAFLGVQLALFGLYMGAVFAPNHKGMPIVPANSRIDFLRRQVLMSRNISGGRGTEWFMGGLNFQVEHHLFPSMPSPNLRLVQPMVREFCERKQIPYTETTLVESYRIVIRYLDEMGLAARDPFQCPLTADLRSSR